MKIVQTENGASAYSDTGSATLDLFYNINTMRQRSESEIETLFAKAFEQNPLDAVRIAFWSRDIRGGQGERRSFKIILRWLANNHPSVAQKNMHLIQEFGRIDDLFCLQGTPLEDDMLNLVSKLLKQDFKSIS